MGTDGVEKVSSEGPNTTPPTKDDLRQGACKLVRDHMTRAGQAVDELVVAQQAEKIVRSLWPCVKRAWEEHANARSAR